MFAAQVGNRHPALRLAQHRHDLGFAKSALLHQYLFEHLAEKVLLLKSDLNIYPMSNLLLRSASAMRV